MKGRKRIIVGNWKMNPTTEREAKEIFLKIRRAADAVRRADVIICPPFLYLPVLVSLSKGHRISLGAQDAFYQPVGPHTGEISPTMLRHAGATHVLLGHSERRSLGETSQFIARKAAAVVADGMTAIVCIGERERDHDGKHFTHVKHELLESLARIGKRDIWRIIVAYEPVWAIGTSDRNAPPPPEILEMTIFIRKVLNDAYSLSAHGVPILYGGSLSPRIAPSILSEGGVDGLLVGHESIIAEHFFSIIKSL